MSMGFTFSCDGSTERLSPGRPPSRDARRVKEKERQMNTKPFGIKVGIAGLALALAGVGCSGAGGDGSPADLVQTSSHSMVIHATISLEEDHVVQFVEY